MKIRSLISIVLICVFLQPYFVFAQETDTGNNDPQGCGTVTSPNIAYPPSSSNTLEHYAWNDVVGWIDMRTDVIPKVEVQTDQLLGCGFINSIGNLSLNCNTTPGGNICTSNGFKVSNRSTGMLAGYAWSDAIGWVSFCGDENGGSVYSAGRWDCPTVIGAHPYGVTIDSSGDFHGWAWNDVIGWISFNCLDTPLGCGAPYKQYKVNTSWHSSPTPPPPIYHYLQSSVFDSCFGKDGLQCITEAKMSLEYLIWRGVTNGGTVEFQLASSRCPNGKGDWNVGATNPSGCDDDTIGLTDGWCDPQFDARCLNGLDCQEALPIPPSINNGNYNGKYSCFIGPGETGGENDYYGINTQPDTPLIINSAFHVNKQFFRYKIKLTPNASSVYPVVQDVILGVVK